MTSSEAINVKKEAYQQCVQWVDRKINVLNTALQQMDESDVDAKSSMGDKYETTRAMLHLEKEKHQVQLIQALKLKKVLDQLDPLKPHYRIELGALVITDKATYYISIGAGDLHLNPGKVLAISPQSPLALQFKSAEPSGQFRFRDQDFRIKQIF